MICNSRYLLPRTKHCLHTIALTFSAIFAAVSPTTAEQCPREGLSAACCERAEPLDGIDRIMGGYAWHPGPSESAGLCQGLASRNVSGGAVYLVDLREVIAPSPLPERVAIRHRDLPWRPIRPFVLSGSPLVPGNAFFIAGTFAEGPSILWETSPFTATGQRLTNFGFLAVARYERRVFYTPLRFTNPSEASGSRTKARLVLRSSEAIVSATVTAVPIDGDFNVEEDKKRVLDHDQRGARRLDVTLPVELPEMFVVSVALCTTVSGPSCKVSDDSPTTISFRIVWPDTP